MHSLPWPVDSDHEALLVVDSLGVRYGRVSGVQDVSLTVGRGEAVALVGPNGAGKTTSLRGISGFLPGEGVRRTGTVTLDGERVDGRRPWDIARLGIAMIPAAVKVFPHLTVHEHLRLAIRGNASRRAGSVIGESLDLFPRLRDRIEAPAAALSGGERQMLALAAATLARPRLLLVDELSQGLAPGSVSAVVDALKTLNQEGMAILLVEQSLATALSVAGRCYALEAGRVVGAGPAEAFAGSEGVQSSYLGRRQSAVSGSAVAAEPVRSRSSTRLARSAVQLTGVSVRFRGLQALSDVALDVEEGERLGLVGPNGAGKTTLLNCVNLAVRPNAGEITVLGRSIGRLRPHQLPELGVARTFQSAEIWSSMSVIDLVTLGTHHLRVGRADAVSKAHRALDFVGLRDVDRIRISDLPYGHAKLADLARALASEPKILLLDEPASGLAQAERVQMAEMLLKIGRELQLTQVLVEHDMQLVRDCCTRVVVLSHGQVIAQGLPDPVLADERVAEELLGISRKKPASTGLSDVQRP